MTYPSAMPFIHDTLAYQDKRMRHQLNSILSKNDGIYQLSALTALRALIPRFWDQHSSNGPFVLTLPDMHQSNIFVDDEWNVTRLIDFEFAPVRPVQMSCVPSWLSGRGVDELEASDLDAYKVLYDDFVAILEQEEAMGHHGNTYSQRLRGDWTTGRLWHSMALESINAFPGIFEQHLRSRFLEDFQLETDGVALARLWDENVDEFLDAKLVDYETYKERVHEIFAEAWAREEKARLSIGGKEETEVSKENSAGGDLKILLVGA